MLYRWHEQIQSGCQCFTSASARVVLLNWNSLQNSLGKTSVRPDPGGKKKTFSGCLGKHVWASSSSSEKCGVWKSVSPSSILRKRFSSMLKCLSSPLKTHQKGISPTSLRTIGCWNPSTNSNLNSQNKPTNGNCVQSKQDPPTSRWKAFHSSLRIAKGNYQTM